MQTEGFSRQKETIAISKRQKSKDISLKHPHNTKTNGFVMGKLATKMTCGQVLALQMSIRQIEKG